MGKVGAPIKRGIEYFRISMDKRLRDNLRIQFGNAATDIWLDLQQNIYDYEGYFCKWNEKELKRFAYNFHHTDHQLINDIVDFLLEENFFDWEAYNKHGILTSLDIQMFYFFVIKRRAVIEFNAEFMYPKSIQYVTEILEKKKEKAKDKEKEEDDDSEFLSTKNVINVNNNSNNGKQETKLLNTGNVINVNNDSGKESNNKGESQIKNEGPEDKIINVNNNSNNGKHELELLSTKNPENDNDNTTKRREEKNRIEYSISNSPTENLNLKVLDGAEKSDQEKKSESPPGQKKKSPHPAREKVIQIWESTFDQSYTQDYEDNAGINKIIKHIENNLRRRNVSEDLLVQEIVNTWERMLQRWDKLQGTHHHQKLSFRSIAKYLPEIINIIFPKNNAKKTSVVGKSKNETDDWH